MSNVYYSIDECDLPTIDTGVVWPIVIATMNRA